mmetsp:Transcript_47086/g.75878  ORF Transcript_47086/g.75878 Transcript_47086/m.75878 type:complete len:425 (+) Transcript_47086:1-1275(+)
MLKERGEGIRDKIKRLARQVLTKFVRLVEEETKHLRLDVTAGMTERSQDGHGYIRTHDTHDDGLSGGLREKIMSPWEVSLVARKLQVYVRAQKNLEVIETLKEIHGLHLPVKSVTTELLLQIKSLQKSTDSRVTPIANFLITSWRQELTLLKTPRRTEASGGQEPLGGGDGTSQSRKSRRQERDMDLEFDQKKVHAKSVDFTQDGKCATRSNRANPKVSVLVLWSNVSASVDAASPGTAHAKKGSRAKGEREKGSSTSTWAIRVNQCQGGSLHIGCVSNAYKSSNAYAESKEWGMVAVMGEAYNLRHTAYFLGSSGQMWECAAKGPRSITALVKQQLADVEVSPTMHITDGTRSFLVDTCNAIRFTTPGSVVQMTLDRLQHTLSFTVNQSPPFVLTGVEADVRPVVALKAVGDSVSIIDPRSVA